MASRKRMATSSCLGFAAPGGSSGDCNTDRTGRRENNPRLPRDFRLFFNLNPEIAVVFHRHRGERPAPIHPGKPTIRKNPN
jgi:hypothetical protein